MLPPSSEALKFSEVQLCHTSKIIHMQKGDTYGWKAGTIERHRELAVREKKEIKQERGNNGKRMEIEGED